MFLISLRKVACGHVVGRHFAPGLSLTSALGSCYLLDASIAPINAPMIVLMIGLLVSGQAPETHLPK